MENGASGWRSRWISPRAGANKLMRIFKEYGAGQLTSSNSEPDPNLNYSQAVLLLGIPKEEWAQFILDMDIEGMTPQELRQAVNHVLNLFIIRVPMLRA